jgi:hypothetical protein
VSTESAPLVVQRNVSASICFSRAGRGFPTTSLSAIVPAHPVRRQNVDQGARLMTMCIRRLRTAVVISGVLGGCAIEVAWSASLVQIHTPVIRTPTVHTIKTNTLKTNTPNNTSSTIEIQSTSSPGSSGATNTESGSRNNSEKGTGPEASYEKGTGSGNNSEKYPQGVHFNNNGASGRPTVTIDGKTMPLNSSTEKLIKEAETPPPKMWLNGQLVPITKANEQKAELELQERVNGRSKTGMINAKLGGKNQ